MAAEIQVLIADDHPIVRQGLRQAIEADAHIKVVAEVGDGATALERIQSLPPQIAVLDIDMPQMDGLAVARLIRERQLPVAVIFLTVHREEAFFTEALEVGAKGYVLKDSAITDIVTCIRAVANGQHFTSPAMTSYLITWSGRARREADSSGHTPSPSDLTPTERRVLSLIAEYKTSKEIAEELFISHRTVQTHRTNICQKLGIQGNHALMKFALTHKDQLS